MHYVDLETCSVLLLSSVMKTHSLQNLFFYFFHLDQNQMSLVCRMVMMKPSVSSPMNATLVSCFSLPEYRVRFLDRLISNLVVQVLLKCLKVAKI